jgi:hypothetical protein
VAGFEGTGTPGLIRSAAALETQAWAVGSGTDDGGEASSLEMDGGGQTARRPSRRRLGGRLPVARSRSLPLCSAMAPSWDHNGAALYEPTVVAMWDDGPVATFESTRPQDSDPPYSTGTAA